jgi:hypothetical protein
MERSTNPEQDTEVLSAVEALFLASGLPVREVASCPVPDCEICKPALAEAA